MKKEIKIITLGDTGVGKTSIINRIYRNEFNDKEISTIGIQHHHPIVKQYAKRNLTLELSFINTAGQERFLDAIPKLYIRNSHIVLLVFCDLLSLETLKDRWFNYYKEHANIKDSKFIVVANKNDLFGEERIKIKELGEKFAEEIDAFFTICSAKSKDNMDNLLSHIITESKRLIDDNKIETKTKKYFEIDDAPSTECYSLIIKKCCPF